MVKHRSLMPFNENFKNSQVTKGFRLHWPNLLSVNLSKFLGGIYLNTMPENGKNSTKLAEKIQNNRIPIGFRTSYRDNFIVGISLLQVSTEFCTCM